MGFNSEFEGLKAYWHFSQPTQLLSLSVLWRHVSTKYNHLQAN